MFLRVALAVFLAGATMVSAEVTDLMCSQMAPNQYKLTYKLTKDSRGVEIFASNDPSGTRGRQKVLITAKTEVTVSAGEPGERMYFFLKPDHGTEREVSIRRLPLEGTPNFRDLGGYRDGGWEVRALGSTVSLRCADSVDAEGSEILQPAGRASGLRLPYTAGERGGSGEVGRESGGAACKSSYRDRRWEGCEGYDE